MTVSRARLAVAARDGLTRVLHASAAPPQHWTFGRSDATGALAVTHQLLGDGVFGGDAHRTSVHVGSGASLVLRGIAATPLRGGSPSAHLIRVRVAAGATAFVFPGPLIPHAQASHTGSLRIEAEGGARVLHASVTTPGRAGAGERGAFRLLRQRATVFVDRRPVLLEDTRLEPDADLIDSTAQFGGAGAVLSILAVGVPIPEVSAIRTLADDAGGVTSLRDGGWAARLLCPSLGEANEIVTSIVTSI